MQPGYEIRQLSPANYEAIVSIWEGSGLPFRPAGRDSRESLEAQMARDPDMYVGAFLGEELVGVVIGTFDGRKGYINRIAVAPAHRRKGIGLALVLDMENRIRARGTGVITTLIEGENPGSYALFEKAGYLLHKDIKYLSKRDSPDI